MVISYGVVSLAGHSSGTNTGFTNGLSQAEGSPTLMPSRSMFPGALASGAQFLLHQGAPGGSTMLLNTDLQAAAAEWDKSQALMSESLDGGSPTHSLVDQDHTAISQEGQQKRELRARRHS